MTSGFTQMFGGEFSIIDCVLGETAGWCDITLCLYTTCTEYRPGLCLCVYLCIYISHIYHRRTHVSSITVIRYRYTTCADVKDRYSNMTEVCGDIGYV